MSSAIDSMRRIPGKVKSKTMTANIHERLLALAEKIIEASAEPSIVKKYFRLKHKMIGGEPTTTPSLSLQATPQKLSGTLKAAAKSRNTTTVEKNGQSPAVPVKSRHEESRELDKKIRSKSTQLIRGKNTQPQEKEENPTSVKRTRTKTCGPNSFLLQFCDAVCNDLSMLRDKILRKEYSRHKLKQVQPHTRQILRESQKAQAAAIDQKLEAYEVAFGKVTLALDVISMQVKQDLLKPNHQNGELPEGERMKQDNVWLLDKVERLLNENYALRSKLIGSDMNAACEEVRNEIIQRPS